MARGNSVPTPGIQRQGSPVRSPIRNSKSETQTVVVSYHESCHLCHGQKISAQPRQLCAAIPGVRLVNAGGKLVLWQRGHLQSHPAGNGGGTVDRKMKHIDPPAARSSPPAIRVPASDPESAPAGKHSAARRSPSHPAAEAYRTDPARDEPGIQLFVLRASAG